MTNKQLQKTSSTALRTETPVDLIAMALDKGADLGQLEKLLKIKKDYEADEARKIFASAFAQAQKKIASVIKTKLNPQTHSKYAELSKVIETAKPVYTEEGFSVIFYEGETATPENVRVCADILHTAGHKETYHYDVPLDGTGIKGNANMTKIHGKSSSVAYGRRYLMCMIWNIPTSDDDGNSGGNIEFISEEDRNKILDGLLAKDIKLEGFLKYMKLEKLEDMPKSKFKQAMIAINGATKKVEEKVKK
ncbi:MAG TPA: hypothetical protein DEP85_04850 [Holosporales bacterium]|nr:hypothetical protein [Holosporales bacterium]